MPIDNFAGRLKGELRVLNAHLPRKQRSLTELLKEEHPHVTCNDGGIHFFKRKELDYLCQMLDSCEQDSLLLPLIIEVSPDQNRVAIGSKKGIEAKIFSKVLGVFAVCEQNMITIGVSQLKIVRKVLRTTTQYVFFL